MYYLPERISVKFCQFGREFVERFGRKLPTGTQEIKTIDGSDLIVCERFHQGINTGLTSRQTL